jgi:hypothetical protein
LKDQNINEIDNNSLFNLDKIQNKFIDKDKLSLFAKDLRIGINNYFLFQNFFYFKWPYWLHNSYSVKSRTFNPVSPFLLNNNNNRDWISIPNQHSSGKVYIDPAGMISPSQDCWSIEFWILEKNILYRPQEKISSILQSRNPGTFIITTKWKEANFEFIESIYNINDDSEELTIEIKTSLLKITPHTCLIIAIRPYNILSLGGVNSVEYSNKTKLLKINSIDKIYLESKPDFILAGNSSAGDIDFNRMDNKTSGIKCSFGMATMAFGYNLSRGDNEYRARLSLTEKGGLNTAKLDYIKIKSKYIEYTNLKLKNGLKVIFPEKLFQNWIYGAKISAFNFSAGCISTENSYNTDLKSMFYVISGYNRMGLLSESLKILESVAGGIKSKEKLSFKNILDRCYFLNAVSDYFKLSRDIDYLRAKYKYLRELIFPLMQYSQTFKENNRKCKKNSIENYYVLEFHIYDLFLLSYTLSEFSYLARCLGIFNDEKKFSKETLRLEGLIINEINKSILDIGIDTDKDNEKEDNTGDARHLENKESGGHRNEYYAYNIFAGYPFNVKSLPEKKLKTIINQISDSFPENPMYFKSIGSCDMFFSIIYAINLLLVKDARVHSIINKIFEFGKEKYILPDYVNPKTGCGIRGEGDSVKAMSSFVTLLRSVLFMDSEEKLEIFPVPKAEWFIEGSEIKIEDAPSIFGLISFKVISTKSEVQFYFSGLPKYLPPSIVINLPFQTKIKQEDDFILKKEIVNSYLIHGWPSIIRFIKK